MPETKTKSIVTIAILSVILFIQEEMLTFLPNIQLTVFLLVLYSKKLGFKKTTCIVLIHVLLDNLVLGSFNIIYTPFMFIGWELIPLGINTIFKKVEKTLHLALLGVLFSFTYSFVYMIPACLILKMDLFIYWSADILFEIVLAASSFLSILWLYEPCAKLFDRYEL
ncbi:MAG: hypothetical protein HUJ53_10435 [Holdemanella sp.]|nr:hypothetical protein [Holdemanella sp.]